MQRVFDKLRLVADDRDVHIIRQVGDDDRHPLFDVVDDGDRVRARLFTDADRDGLYAVQSSCRCRLGTGLLHLADISDLYGVAVTGGDHDVAELLDLGKLAERSDAVGSLAFDQVAAGHLLIL